MSAPESVRPLPCRECGEVPRAESFFRGPVAEASVMHRAGTTCTSFLRGAEESIRDGDPDAMLVGCIQSWNAAQSRKPRRCRECGELPEAHVVIVASTGAWSGAVKHDCGSGGSWFNFAHEAEPHPALVAMESFVARWNAAQEARDE